MTAPTIDPSPAPGPAATPARTRLPGFDVARGVALIGVVVMNYHGYLNGGAQGDPPSLAERIFHPWHGVLSTRFAAVFVTVAGIGTVLLTNRSRLSGDRAAVRDDRWRLVRRGFLLFWFGFVLNWIWDGTILFFYGAYFIVAAAIFTLRVRWLALIGTVSVIGAWAIQIWLLHVERAGGDSSWLSTTALDRSPRGLLFDVTVNGTHPLLPWLGFFCSGMILGRLVPDLYRYRRRLLALGALLLAGGYGLATVLRLATKDATSEFGEQVHQLSLTDPFSRMPLYVVTTLGSSILAVLVIAQLADRFPHSPVVDVLRRAGQMTLSIYALHVVVFDEVVNQRHWVRATGLDTALVFALVFWVLAILLGAWWHRFVGRGPLEAIYRRFGG